MDPDTYMKENYFKDCYEHKVDLDGRYNCYMGMEATKRKIKETGLSFLELT